MPLCLPHSLFPLLIVFTLSPLIIPLSPLCLNACLILSFLSVCLSKALCYFGLAMYAMPRNTADLLTWKPPKWCRNTANPPNKSRALIYGCLILSACDDGVSSVFFIWLRRSAMMWGFRRKKILKQPSSVAREVHAPPPQCVSPVFFLWLRRSAMMRGFGRKKIVKWPSSAARGGHAPPLPGVFWWVWS